MGTLNTVSSTGHRKLAVQKNNLIQKHPVLSNDKFCLRKLFEGETVYK
jgi:hypothetical protein